MRNSKKNILFLLVAVFLFFGGWQANPYFSGEETAKQATADSLHFDEQEATIQAIKKVIPAVVSIIVYDQEQSIVINLETGENTKENKKVEKGSGTGILISADGFILTNRHVVNVLDEKTAEYRVILDSGKQYYAQMIGKDKLNDLAVLKIFDKNLPFVELGDSSQLQVGQSVIAIGNSLGLYHNSVTKGIVSALGRSIVASDQSSGGQESLDNVIQTDAKINVGNSGGPLIDLNGRVAGVNVATEISGASVGFAIPINDVKPVIKSVREIGRIVRPRLGIRYQMITPELSQEKNLARNSGALIVSGEHGEPGIVAGSPAEKIGLEVGDIVFEVNSIKIDEKNTLLSILQKYKPRDKIGLKLQRGNKVMIKVAELDEFK